MSLCYMNGKFAPISECALPVSDLAIQRGVGAFESIRLYGGKPFAISLHLERLANSVKDSGIEADAILAKLPELIREGIRQSDCPQDGLAKPFITGGDVNNKGHFPQPRFFILFEDVHKLTDDEKKQGIALEPNHIDRPYPLVKSINYLFGLMPLSKAQHDNFESLYVTPAGEITEAMSSNFFLCKDGKLITAPVGRVLKGVTRSVVLTLAKEAGYKIEERCPLESELKEAQEAFITGSVKEVLSVVRVGAQNIGNGKPGPVAQHLQHMFVANRERWLDK
jgi:branched-subunit amino acid aminotransferase/4-amino-4-deoxychorismate lyase